MNGERRDPTHSPHLGTPGEEKEWETERNIAEHRGERITGIGIKILD